MRFAMNPDMVYQYPIWAVGLLLVGAAVFGAVLLELCARLLLPIELRQRHNDVAAAIFSIIGVTYAVLLAFVAMLAWEGFNRAKAASYAEAARIGNVYNLSAGFADPEKSSIRNEIFPPRRCRVRPFSPDRCRRQPRLAWAPPPAGSFRRCCGRPAAPRSAFCW